MLDVADTSKVPVAIGVVPLMVRLELAALIQVEPVFTPLIVPNNVTEPLFVTTTSASKVAVPPPNAIAFGPPIVIEFGKDIAPAPVLLNVPELVMLPPKTKGEVDVVVKFPVAPTEKVPEKVFVPPALLSASVPLIIVLPAAVTF